MSTPNDVAYRPVSLHPTTLRCLTDVSQKLLFYRTPLSLCNALFNTTKPWENFHIPTSKHSIDIVSLESVDKDHQAMSTSAATKAALAEAGTCRCVMDGSTKRLSLGSCTFHCLLNSFITPLRKQAQNCLRKV